MILRNGIYYFILRVGNKVTRKSLNTDNLTLAILLKLKILQHLQHLQLAPATLYYTFFSPKNAEILKDFKINTLLHDVENSVKRALNIEHKVIDTPLKEKNRLSTFAAEFIADKKQLGTSAKTIIKYKQSIEYLEIYFGATVDLSIINYKAVNSFKAFLFKLPQRWKNKRDINKSNLKKMVEKNSPVLARYEKLNINTVLEILKRCKEIFEYFMANEYISKNYFTNLDVTRYKKRGKREFKHDEFKSLLRYCKDKELQEEYNFFLFLLMSGLRRGEALSIPIKNIEIEKYTIEVMGTKTDAAHRIGVIHKDCEPIIREQMKNKSESDYLFFNREAIEIQDKPLHRDKSAEEKQVILEQRIGIRLNKHIKLVIGADNKREVDIHSLRKNYAQVLYMVNELKDTELKTLIGHSTSKDVTDTHYLRGKRDSAVLKRKIDLADFGEFFLSECAEKS